MAVTTAETTQSDLMTLTIDGVETSVPKGTLLIRAAEELGVAVPRFCDHPLLDPVAACRACLVEIEGQAKPQPACAVTAAEGMVVRTQVTSEVADKAQHGVLEFLLVNHPLDCPICDKGGECPLQNQAMSNGRGDARFDGYKRTFPKPINISSNVLLDRERCVLCARCTRFSNQIAGDPFIELLERGALQQVGIYENQPFESYFSGNTVQICPVGALTSASYRFRARPFDLISTPSTCEHCAAGCAQRTDHRRGRVTRRLAANDPAVNEEWNCDKGGECPLQNQSMANGAATSRFKEKKRAYPKPLAISSQILLDRERCVLCQRCTRFSEEIAGDKFIDLMGRSSAEEINIYRDDAYGEEGDAGD
ncbi:MAG: 2Fe-2S iron-sulfur cluster-binding protein, partial [Candidatus Nanopelagicales bacterium]